MEYLEFSQKHFKGKEVFNKKSGKVYQKWEAYLKIKNFTDMVLKGEHIEFGVRDKVGWVNGHPI